MVDSISEGTAIQTREYGTSGPMVLVLHGGPGAPNQRLDPTRASRGVVPPVLSSLQLMLSSEILVQTRAGR
jgi:hypothetical protein